MIRAAILATVFLLPIKSSAEEIVSTDAVERADACNYFFADYLERNLKGRPGPKLQFFAANATIRPTRLDRYVEMMWLDVEFSMSTGAGVFAEVVSSHLAHVTCTVDIIDRRVLTIDVTNIPTSRDSEFKYLPFETANIGGLVHGGRY